MPIKFCLEAESPSRRNCAQDFYVLKIHRHQPGLAPRARYSETTEADNYNNNNNNNNNNNFCKEQEHA